ncbi:MAG: ABC transporter permease [Acidimicrobiales bacterium]
MTAAARVTEREIRFFAATWRANVVTLFGVPCLFLVALGIGLGGLIDDRASLDGLDYVTFLTPGLMVGAAAQLATGTGLWPVMAGHRWVGFHRAMVTTPIRPSSIVAGLIGWVGVRSAAQAGVVLSFAVVLGAVTSPWAVAAVAIAALTAVAFAAPTMAYAATCDSDRAFDPIMRVVAQPLYLFSGAFFPADTLPLGLRGLMACFPLWHGIELARWATAGRSPSWSPGLHLVVIVVWAAGGWLVARRTFAARLTP